MGEDKVAFLVCSGSSSVIFIPAQVSSPSAAFADHSHGQSFVSLAAPGAEGFLDTSHNPVFSHAGTCEHSRAHSLSKRAAWAPSLLPFVNWPLSHPHFPAAELFCLAGR